MTVAMSRPEWRAGVGSVLGSSWTSYTPILTASVTNPTGWNAQGRFCQIGPTVFYTFRILPGASATQGSGVYYISLPVTAARYGGAPWVSGSAYIADSATANGYNAVAYLSTTNLLQLIYPVPAGTSSYVGAGAPWTWSSGDDLNGFVMYEAALPT
jgi:hypothetical protein